MMKATNGKKASLAGVMKSSKGNGNSMAAGMNPGKVSTPNMPITGMSTSGNSMNNYKSNEKNMASGK